jgi:hypothetical protein
VSAVVYYVVAIAGRPVVLARHEGKEAALRDFDALGCPSLAVRVADAEVEILAARGLIPVQVDTAMIEAIRRVCGRASVTYDNGYQRL